MKKLFIVMLALVNMTVCLDAQILYRKADESDVLKLLKIYAFIDQKDVQGKHNLLLFPEEVRALKIEKDINDGRIFVALDENKNMVGFMKMFLVSEKAEKLEILHEELRCIPSNQSGVPLLNGLYDIPSNQLQNFTYRLVLNSQNALQGSIIDSLCEVREDATYLYFGGAYTLSQYRKCGISTNLITYAFMQLKNDILESGPLVLLYGQVEANTRQKHMVRAFAQFVAKYYLEEAQDVTLFHCAYKAYKPELFFEEKLAIGQRTFKTMKCRFPEENQGQGNMLIFMRK